MQKLEKRLKVITEEEKKMPVFEAPHSALISSDESDEEVDVRRTWPLEWRSDEVSIFFTIWSLAIEKVCPISKEGNVLTEGSALQVPETIMKFLSHCSGPLNCSSFRFSMLGNSGTSIHF